MNEHLVMELSNDCLIVREKSEGYRENYLVLKKDGERLSLEKLNEAELKKEEHLFYFERILYNHLRFSSKVEIYLPKYITLDDGKVKFDNTDDVIFDSLVEIIEYLFITTLDLYLNSDNSDITLVIPYYLNEKLTLIYSILCRSLAYFKRFDIRTCNIVYSSHIQILNFCRTIETNDSFIAHIHFGSSFCELLLVEYNPNKENKSVFEHIVYCNCIYRSEDSSRNNIVKSEHTSAENNSNINVKLEDIFDNELYLDLSNFCHRVRTETKNKCFDLIVSGPLGNKFKQKIESIFKKEPIFIDSVSYDDISMISVVERVNTDKISNYETLLLKYEF